MEEDLIGKVIYLVGTTDEYSSPVSSVHVTRDGAITAWNKIRLDLIKEAKKTWGKSEDPSDKLILEEIITPLVNEDPFDKSIQYSGTRPYLDERKLER